MKKFLAAITAALAINAFAGVQVTKQYCDHNAEMAVSNSYQLVKVEAAKLPGIASNVTASITPQIITNKVDEVMRSESIKPIITNAIHNTIMNEPVVSNAVSAAAYDAAGRYTDQASDYAYIASTCAVASATSYEDARIEAANALNSEVRAGNSAQSARSWAETSRSYSDSSHSAYNDIVVFTNWFEVNKGQVVTNVHVYYPGLETLVNTNWVADFYFVRKSDRGWAYQRMYFDGCCKGRNGNPAYIFKRRSTTPTMMADWGFGFNFRKAIVTPNENALKRGTVYPFIDAEVEKFNIDGSSLGVFKYSSSIQSDTSWPSGTFVFYEDDEFRLQTQRGPSGTYGSPNQTYRVEFATQDEIKEIDDLKSSISSFESRVGDNISNLQTRMGTAEDDISGLTSRMSNTEDKINCTIRKYIYYIYRLNPTSGSTPIEMGYITVNAGKFTVFSSTDTILKLRYDFTYTKLNTSAAVNIGYVEKQFNMAASSTGDKAITSIQFSIGNDQPYIYTPLAEGHTESVSSITDLAVRPTKSPHRRISVGGLYVGEFWWEANGSETIEVRGPVKGNGSIESSSGLFPPKLVAMKNDLDSCLNSLSNWVERVFQKK